MGHVLLGTNTIIKSMFVLINTANFKILRELKKNVFPSILILTLELITMVTAYLHPNQMLLNV